MAQLGARCDATSWPEIATLANTAWLQPTQSITWKQ
jgi:hypothetical protein